MYALAVIDWLVAQHNELVQIVAGSGCGRDGHVKRPAEKSLVIDLHLDLVFTVDASK